jgi:hypothetical protein
MSIPTQLTNFRITKIDASEMRPKGEGYLPESKVALECGTESLILGFVEFPVERPG